MKQIIGFLLLIFFLTGCKKEEKASSYMSGYIYNNCYDRQPLRNVPIRLYRTKLGVIAGGDVVASGSTDQNGYFKLSFPPDHAANWMKLQTASGGDFMEKIPPDKNYDNVEVFATIFANINVSLNVINPHNAGDTLDLKRLGAAESIKIPCPLVGGSIYTTYNYIPINPMGYNGTEDYIVHAFRPSTGFAYFTYFKIDKYCQDTVYVTVDIN